MSRFFDAPFGDVALVLQPPLDGTVGEAEVVAFVPGPAGTAATVVHADLSLEVDYAEPDQLCSIVADDVGASRSLELLIGPKPYLAVRSALLQGGDNSRRVTAGSQRARGRPFAGSLPPRDEEVRQFGFSMAARAVGDDVYEDDLVRAVAYVESAALLVDSSWLDNVDLSVLEEQLAFASVVIAADLEGDGILGDLGARDDERLREAVFRVATRSAWADRSWARELRDRLPRRVFDLDDERWQRAAMLDDLDVAYGAPGAAPRLLSSSGAPSPRVEAPPPEPTIDTLGPGRFVFRYAVRPDGSWLRLVHRQTQALVALVPITWVGRRWEAQVVLPTTLDVASVVAEPTDTPVMGSTSSVDLMIDAIECGRVAARRSAAGDPTAASEWRRCARRWRELGDDTRANRAMAYAAGNQQVTRPAFVHDAVRTELE